MSKPPDNLICPISGTVFVDPVLCVGDGHTYERKDIQRWINMARERGAMAKSPMGGLPMSGHDLVSNHIVRSSVSAWKAGVNAADSFSDYAPKGAAWSTPTSGATQRGNAYSMASAAPAAPAKNLGGAGAFGGGGGGSGDSGDSDDSDGWSDLTTTTTTTTSADHLRPRLRHGPRLHRSQFPFPVSRFQSTSHGILPSMYMYTQPAQQYNKTMHATAAVSVIKNSTIAIDHTPTTNPTPSPASAPNRPRPPPAAAPRTPTHRCTRPGAPPRRRSPARTAHRRPYRWVPPPCVRLW